MSGFIRIQPKICSICLDGFHPNQVPIAHKEGGGEKHPFHEHCLQALISANLKSDSVYERQPLRCPVCKITLSQSLTEDSIRNPGPSVRAASASATTPTAQNTPAPSPSEEARSSGQQEMASGSSMGPAGLYTLIELVAQGTIDRTTSIENAMAQSTNALQIQRNSNRPQSNFPQDLRTRMRQSESFGAFSNSISTLQANRLESQSGGLSLEALYNVERILENAPTTSTPAPAAQTSSWNPFRAIARWFGQGFAEGVIDGVRNAVQGVIDGVRNAAQRQDDSASAAGPAAQRSSWNPVVLGGRFVGQRVAQRESQGLMSVLGPLQDLDSSRRPVEELPGTSRQPQNGNFSGPSSRNEDSGYPGGGGS